jgi:hypothetical protein
VSSERGADRFGLRPVATTAWPATRAAFAMSTPRPRPAPVMNHTCLFIKPQARIGLILAIAPTHGDPSGAAGLANPGHAGVGVVSGDPVCLDTRSLHQYESRRRQMPDAKGVSQCS